MYRVKETVRVRAMDADGSYWAFDLASGEHFELNTTAFHILQAVQAGQVPERIAAIFVSEYGLSGDAARDDINAALNDLVVAGLIGEVTE